MEEMYFRAKVIVMTVQQVLDLRQKGMTDNQVIQELQKQGMSTQQIFDSLSQADLAGPSAQSSWEGDMPPMPAPPGMGMPEQAHYAQQQSQQYSGGEERLQEVAEAIISEKWDELLKEMQKVVGWKERMDGEVQSMKDALSSLKEEFNQLRQGILGKVTEADERMREVSSELKAVHNIFKDVLPTFTENVAELSRVTSKLSPKKK